MSVGEGQGKGDRCPKMKAEVRHPRAKAWDMKVC